MTARAIRKAEAIFSIYRKGNELPDIDYIINQIGIDIKPFIFPNHIRGCLTYEGGYIFMGINQNHLDNYPNLARFTKAHELGHSQLHEEQQYFCMDDFFIDNNNRLLEWEANNFAAELLMPTFLIKRYYKEMSVDELCCYFKVSKEAIVYKLKNLGLII